MEITASSFKLRANAPKGRKAISYQMKMLSLGILTRAVAITIVCSPAIALSDNISKPKLDNTSHQIFIEDFGGEANSITLDNTPFLLKAIKHLSSLGGGTLNFRSGTYNFKSPLILTFPLVSIKIVGIGMSDPSKTYGTMLNYTGEDYFIEIAEGGQSFELSDFSIDCNGANGIKIKQGIRAVVTSNFRRLFITNYTEGIDARDFAYVRIEECSLLAAYDQPNTATSFGIRIGAGSGIKEFIYLDKVNVDGGAGSNANDRGVTGNGVEIQDSNNVYISRSDFSNWGEGKGLLLRAIQSSLYLVFIDNLNVTRADGGIEIFADSEYITQIALSNISLVHRGEKASERGIYLHGKNSFVPFGVSMSNIFLRKIGKTPPQFDIENINGEKIFLNFCQSFSGGKLIGVQHTSD